MSHYVRAKLGGQGSMQFEACINDIQEEDESTGKVLQVGAGHCWQTYIQVMVPQMRSTSVQVGSRPFPVAHSCPGPQPCVFCCTCACTSKQGMGKEGLSQPCIALPLGPMQTYPGPMRPGKFMVTAGHPDLHTKNMAHLKIADPVGTILRPGRPRSVMGKGSGVMGQQKWCDEQWK